MCERRGTNPPWSQWLCADPNMTTARFVLRAVPLPGLDVRSARVTALRDRGTQRPARLCKERLWQSEGADVQACLLWARGAVHRKYNLPAGRGFERFAVAVHI